MIDFEGKLLQGRAGDTIAGVLLANNLRFFVAGKQRSPRGPFCNMGICYDCLVLVREHDGAEPRMRRGCMTAIALGMKVNRCDAFGE